MINKNMFIKPRIPLEGQPVPPAAQAEEMMRHCPACKHGAFPRELRANNMVCPYCGHHFRLSARQRIDFLADEGTFVEHDEQVGAEDRIGFPQYPQKLQAARAQSGEMEAVVTGVCSVDGTKTAIFSMEADFMMGSMSAAVGDKIARLFEYATVQRLPVVGFTVSGGARVQEGILSLMQMAKTSGAVKRHSDEGLFYLVVLTDPTTGGVTASFAMEGDVILAEPEALIGFAGPRVIQQTMRQTLPPGFQRAEFLLEKGFVDRIVPRKEQRQSIGMLLRLNGEAPYQACL